MGIKNLCIDCTHRYTCPVSCGTTGCESYMKDKILADNVKKIELLEKQLHALAERVAPNDMWCDKQEQWIYCG